MIPRSFIREEIWLASPEMLSRENGGLRDSVCAGGGSSLSGLDPFFVVRLSYRFDGGEG